jgi:hypothetical protein
MMKMMCLGVVVGSLLSVAPARASTMSQKCVVANMDCFPLRASAQKMTPEQRTDQVNDRLAYILGYEALEQSNIRTRMTNNGEVEIRVGSSLLVTVTEADARASGAADIQSLAQIWTNNLRVALPQASPKASG